MSVYLFIIKDSVISHMHKISEAVSGSIFCYFSP